ncbi:TPA: RNA chaperone ProQ [Mannheimia haemolytica]|uniref:RNA chaperone ProQ n=1 Tax=Mannheimia haemolytica TaxID=75985 RepID=A0A378NF40_MANHA|nr:RNA chaperone ProQ [Mannheimia haemolytica]AGQ38450.1 osmoprotectant transporter ProQ [Mannheimia haemolytica D171]AJE07420.1 RNA chaperone ProQ [Mannheimia haemolytica USDA-ARS-USMARC-184]EEY10800.1 ProQ activator of osmoprotectant transporter ProP [Mannheimia haemolytica serotype A2 str. OVINE]EEY11583.1 ProQ activator of osmoprotectant transporter ProP [Mannheimia haemolytica serotype A2 str. BOVINE]KYL17568.1 osmoprotectant transporter ProQ [Mannheimia haemolytica]
MSEQIEQKVEQTQNKTNPSTKEVIAYLAEKFPLCFTLEGEVKPLKVGLFQELAEALKDDEKISKTLLRQVLRNYTNSWRYLAASQANVARVGLQGEEVGVVTEDEATHAAEALAAAKVVAERKAQERKAQRKEYFKQKAREENAKKRAEFKAKKAIDNLPKASEEKLAALADKFGRK